ncbi:unnamed protein product, partial [Polarella glacialis]
ALARMTGVNAVIYQPSEASGRPDNLMKTAVEITASDSDDARCVQLSFHPNHHAGQHYNSVRCREDEGEGPAPVASLEELRRRLDDALRPKEKEPEPSEAEASSDSTKPKSKVFF